MVPNPIGVAVMFLIWIAVFAAVGYAVYLVLRLAIRHALRDWDRDRRESFICDNG